MSTWMLTKRKELRLSQSDMAATLGVSRPTYVAMEKGERKLTVEQEALLARMFNVSRDTVVKNADVTPKHKETLYVKQVPKEQVEKFEQVLLYIVSKVGSRPNIGQTALYKLLYFIDFDYYEKHHEYLMGATYIKNTHGPSPVSFAKITRNLEVSGKLVQVQSKYFGFDQKKYLVTAEPIVSTLSAQELKHIDNELERLASKSAKELSDLSHIDTPWRVAKDKQVLNYQHVFYRPDETSVGE